MTYQKRKGLTIQSIDDETLILDLETDHIHQLNPTASFIWGMIDEAPSVVDLVEAYAAHFDIEIETARVDVLNMLDQLCDMGLIVDTLTLAPSPPAEPA